MDKYSTRKFELSFRLDDVGFISHQSENAEIARILRKIADKLNADSSTTEGAIRDIDGNRIGSFHKDEREGEEDDDAEDNED